MGNIHQRIREDYYEYKLDDLIYKLLDTNVNKQLLDELRNLHNYSYEERYKWLLSKCIEFSICQ